MNLRGGPQNLQFDPHPLPHPPTLSPESSFLLPLIAKRCARDEVASPFPTIRHERVPTKLFKLA